MTAFVYAVACLVALSAVGDHACLVDETASEAASLLQVVVQQRPQTSQVQLAQPVVEDVFGEAARARNLLQLPTVARASEDGLLSSTCDWGQRWALAMFAPLNPHPTDEGSHERLGCCSTSLAQVMYFHRRCPTGSVDYTVPGFEATGMDFDEEARGGLCDWPRFASRSVNVTADAGTSAVARYIYAAALVVRRRWGSTDLPHYLLVDNEQDVSVSEHYGMAVSRFHVDTVAARVEAEALLVQELDGGRPVIACLARPHGGHLAVLDSFRRRGSGLEVHVNAGYDGFNSGWFNFHGPFCFAHHQNGTLQADGSCAHRYSHVSYLKFVRPAAPLKA